MNGRQRFSAVMRYRKLDRLPRFEEGIRDDVRQSWELEGLPVDADLAEYFGYDRRDEIEFDLDPLPRLHSWPMSAAELEDFKSRLDPDHERRNTGNTHDRIVAWQNRTEPLILRVQRGFFLSMGVEGWKGFNTAIALTKDAPDVVAEILRLQGELSAKLTQRLLAEVSVEAALFSEPIGGNHGPLISPGMYRDLVLPSYQPILDVLKQHQVETIIVRTYANPRPLIPLFIEAGINCLWAVEAPPEAMDYLQLRREFGKGLRLIGGIDTDALRTGREAITAAVQRLEPLVGDGGVIPLLDGRVREDVGYEDYLFYRKLLLDLTS